MKPEWKDAPEWAIWLAQDKIGYWYWYSVQPKPSYADWRYEPNTHFSFAGDGGADNSYWYTTLEERP